MVPPRFLSRYERETVGEGEGEGDMACAFWCKLLGIEDEIRTA